MNAKSRYDESKSVGFIILYTYTTAIQTVYSIRNHGCCSVLVWNHWIATKCVMTQSQKSFSLCRTAIFRPSKWWNCKGKHHITYGSWCNEAMNDNWILGHFPSKIDDSESQNHQTAKGKFIAHLHHDAISQNMIWVFFRLFSDFFRFLCCNDFKWLVWGEKWWNLSITLKWQIRHNFLRDITWN